MRINKLRKITALILLAVLSLSLLSGCSRIRDRIDAVKAEEEAEAATEAADVENTESLSEKSAKKTDALSYGAITGKVVDAETGKVLTGVEYVLTADNAPTDKVTVRNDGSFYFEALGHYEITFEKDGYKSVELGYDVKKGETLDYGEIAMNPVVDMSDFNMTEGHQFLIKWWLQRIFESENNGYQNSTITKAHFGHKEVPASVWASNLYLYIASNKLKDSRISNFSGDYGEEWHRMSEADVRSLIQEVTGFDDASYCDDVIENLKTGSHEHSAGNVEISTVAYLGDSGYFYFKDITGYGIATDVMFVDGIVTEQGGAHRTFTFRGYFTAGNPDAPMPWVFDSLEVDTGDGASGNGNASSSVSNQSDKGSYTTTDTITMRPGTSLDSGEIMKIPSGSSVTVLDFGAKGFYHVRYGGKEGYALASYMQATNGAEKQQAQSGFYVKNNTCIYGWPRPSNAEQITALAPGDYLEYFEESENGTWFVRFNNLYGFYDPAQGGVN